MPANVPLDRIRTTGEIAGPFRRLALRRSALYMLIPLFPTIGKSDVCLNLRDYHGLRV